MSIPHETFGRELASALGQGPSAATLRAQEQRLIEWVKSEEGSRRPRFGSAFAWAFAMVAVVVVLGGLWVVRAVDEPSLWARSAGALVPVDTVLDAPPGKSRRLSFSDGSQVELGGKTALKLVELSPRHTQVALERGRLDLDVKHRPDSDWTITAGRYRVRVVGTRFSVLYDEAHSSLVVEVAEGRVVVSGGELPQAGVSLIAGASFTAGAPNSRAAGEARSKRSPGPDADAVSDSPLLEEQPKRANTPKETVDAPSFRELATRGKYAEAVAAAEAEGFESLLARLSDGDLLLLANSARFCGRTGRAKQGFLKLRERYAGRPAAVLASYYLARQALDVDHDDRQAARWFKTYLRESPRGELAASARIELMNILLRAGDPVGARRIAQAYLEYHPGGAHASLARSVIDRVPAE